MEAPELSVIIPTFNERANVGELVVGLDRCLGPSGWEAIFVDDDSSDGTAEAVAALAKDDPRIRCLRRVGRRGLSSACIEGMASSTADFLAVMDGDLQHDETLLPAMLGQMKSGAYDVVIGSRYIAGGGVGGWNKHRRALSRIATISAQKFIRCNVSDPMSGFFMLRRSVFWDAAHDLSGQGFKILLDILASSRGTLRVLELPYQFRDRRAGQSKLDSGIALEYIFLLADKLFGRFLPLRFVLFTSIGSSGVLVHFAVLLGIFRGLHEPFFVSQAAATGVAMVYNFFLNNLVTYRDRRLRGPRLILGLFLFAAVCSVGAVTNVQVADYLFRLGAAWWLAAAVGIVIVSVWNYGVTSQLVWRPKKRP